MQNAHHQLAEALELDKRILETHALLSRAGRDLALLLAEMADRKHFLDLGYANLCQYAQTKLQIEPRKTRGLVRIGRALPDLPVLDQAFASGALCWTKARELLAVIAPETEVEDLQNLVKSIPNGRTRVILEDVLQVLWETARTRVTEDQASSRAVAQSRDGP